MSSKHLARKENLSSVHFSLMYFLSLFVNFVISISDVPRTPDKKVQFLLNNIHWWQHSEPAKPQEHDQMVKDITICFICIGLGVTCKNTFKLPAFQLFCVAFSCHSLSVSLSLSCSVLHWQYIITLRTGMDDLVDCHSKLCLYCSTVQWQHRYINWKTLWHYLSITPGVH